MSESVCRVCGWMTMPGFDLCVGCLDIHEWSRVNRAFCEFFHRTPRLTEMGDRALLEPSTVE